MWHAPGAWIREHKLLQCRAAIADQHRRVLQRDGRDAAHGFGGMAHVEDAGLALIGHEFLQEKPFAARKGFAVVQKSGAVSDQTDAGAVAADVGLGDDRIGDAGCRHRRFASLGVGFGAIRHDARVTRQQVACRQHHLIEDLELRFAAQSSRGDRRIGRRRQREAAIADAEREPVRNDRQIERPVRPELEEGQRPITRGLAGRRRHAQGSVELHGRRATRLVAVSRPATITKTANPAAPAQRQAPK